MGDIVTFTLELNEKLSGGMQRAGVATHSVFATMGNDITNTQRGLDDLGRERRINVDHSAIREAHGAVEGLTGAMERLSSMQVMGGMAVGELLAQGVERSVEFAKEQVMDVLHGGLEEGKLKIEMGVLAGPEAGKELYESIHNYIPKSIFGPELNHEAVVLMGMGETMKNILPDLKEFGDISMGDAQKMQSLILALGEAKAEGHLSGLEMRILRTTGFNPLVETSRVTGESMASLTDKMSDGRFSFNMLRKSMEYATAEGGRFHDMQNKILQDPSGQLQRMTTNIEQAKAELGLALLPAEANVFKALEPMIESLPDQLERMRPGLEHMINDFADLVKWTSNNTETLSRWFGVIKVGAEAYVAWKVGSTALAAANWIWTASIGAQEVATVEATTAMEAQNAVLLEQAELVEGLGLKWATMGAAEREAMLMAAQGSFALPINTMGAAGMANAGGMGLAGGFAAGVSAAVIPVAVMYFGAQAGEAMGLWKVKSGMDMWVPDAVLIELGTDEYSERLRAQDQARRDRNNLNMHPVQSAAGWDINNMLGAGLGTNSNILVKYGVKEPNGATGGGRGAGDLSSVSDSIIGGGPKQIHITAKFMEHATVHVANGKDGVKELFRNLKEEYYSMLKSIPGME